MSNDSPNHLDAGWALSASAACVAGVVSYGVLIAVHLTPPAQAALAFTFSLGLTLFSIGMYRVLAGAARSALELVAAVANTVAAALLLAMLLVQIAVEATIPKRDPGLTAIWLGLDVAWDLYVAVGTLLFAAVMLRRRMFGAWLGVPGVAIGAVLFALNVATSRRRRQARDSSTSARSWRSGTWRCRPGWPGSEPA
jgi:hypothetical protein